MDTNFAPAEADPLLDRLKEQHKALSDRADELTAAVKRSPEKIDDANIDRVTAFVKQIKACAKDAETKREAEKADFLKAGRKVDAFFKALTVRLEQAAQTIESRVQVYLRAKAEEERRRREEEARKAREEAERAAAEARRIREEEERKAREAREAEERRLAALKAEDDAVAALAAQKAAAEAAERAEQERIAREAQALAEAQRRQEEAAEAERRANAKVADMARTRGALGGVATLATKIEFEVTNRQAAMDVLWRYLDDEAVAKAARALQRDHSAEIKAALKTETQLFPGIRFFESHAARVA